MIPSIRWWPISRTTISALLLLPAIAAAAPLEDWSSFQNGGRSTTDVELPLRWAPDSEAIAWQAEIPGYGQSTPVVGGGRVFVTSTSGDNKEQFHLTAWDLATGEKLWQTDFANPSPEPNNSYVSRAAPSPVVDADGVHAYFEGGIVASVDFTGSVRWQRDLVAEYGPIAARHGLASSLEHDATRIFVWVERQEEPYLAALDKRTGETVWKVPGLGSTTWGSPRLITVGNGAHLVCSAVGKIVGFDPTTGERRWELEGIANNSSSTPIPAGDGRFFIGASDGRGEAPAAGGAANAGGLVRITPAADGSTSAEFVWRADRARISFGSPLVAAGHVWAVNRTGALFQLDLETGEQVKVHRTDAGSVWATPIASAGKIYLFGQTGTTTILSVADGQVLADNRLWPEPTSEGEGPGAAGGAMGGPVQYAAAVADRTLLIRRGDRLFAIR